MAARHLGRIRLRVGRHRDADPGRVAQAPAGHRPGTAAEAEVMQVAVRRREGNTADRRMAAAGSTGAAVAMVVVVMAGVAAVVARRAEADPLTGPRQAANRFSPLT